MVESDDVEVITLDPNSPVEVFSNPLEFLPPSSLVIFFILGFLIRYAIRYAILYFSYYNCPENGRERRVEWRNRTMNRLKK